MREGWVYVCGYVCVCMLACSLAWGLEERAYKDRYDMMKREERLIC